MKWAWALVFLGAALRFWFAHTADEVKRDERFRYLPMAESVRDGHGLPSAEAMPLWPLVLSAAPSRHLNALLSAACLPLAWLLAQRFGGPRTALFVLALMSFDLDQAKLGGTFLTEPLFTLLLLAFALAWAHGRTAAAAGLLGLATLTRPEAFLVPFLFLCFSPLQWRRALLLLAGVVVLLAPWVVRNARAYGEFIPFTTRGRITLVSGMNPAEEELSFRRKCQGRGPLWEKRYAGIDPVRYALNHPAAALEITAAKAVLLATLVQRKGSSAVYALAVLLAWWALLRGARYRSPLVGPMLALMTLVGLVFLAIPRYRAPYHAFVFLAAVPPGLRAGGSHRGPHGG